MGLFGKKKETDENEDFQTQEFEGQLPVKKTALTPPRRIRKPKEAIKPWGKKERLFVFYILVFTTLVSAFFGLSAREWKLPGLPKLKFELPNFSSGKIVLESENKKNTENDQLAKEFKNTTDNLSGVYGMYVFDLKNEKESKVNADEVFQAASLIKLPLIIAAYQEVEKGNLNLDTKYTLKESDKIGGSGSLQYKSAGEVLTYKQLLNLMGKQSDNTAFGIIKNKLGERKINETINEIGMTKTSLDENETSPEDIGKLLLKLYKGNLVNNENKDEILDSLTDTVYENHLKAGVPENVRVAHKYGREIHVVNDAGIVFSNNPYIVVIMSKGVVESEADTSFPRLSKIIYESLE